MALLHVSVGDHPPSMADATIEPFPGFRVVPWMSMRIEGEANTDYEPEIEVTFDVSESRYRPTFIGVRADEVNGTMLRTVRVTDYLRGAARLGIYSALDASDGEAEPLAALFDFAGPESIFGDEFADLLKNEGPTPFSISHVGFSYVFAQLAAEPPAKAVQRDLHLTARTADNWIAKAKANGLLVPSTVDHDVSTQLSAWQAVMGRHEGMTSDE
ncbi:hypothetical protein [Curtobacterium flaccumfaciens]|uniref:hypothetical protein n=1 Tax=Curtobacterium flaccumfaciens TaxID=2035 RepID=UPI000FFF53BA|nr:hypothetical protein [Curtobacterium flaccumfaciens]MCS0644987.1 hypothetical protein [Curtobacterium flaccumfaciens pv. flaccumfaciens]MCS6526725.1 hypothetical protein [Curtobacterium flaccumfaciens pv. flaccumfaciens]NUU12132.1 hypothetical protein [Curtobacterium flaccumfaciens]